MAFVFPIAFQMRLRLFEKGDEGALNPTWALSCTSAALEDAHDFYMECLREHIHGLHGRKFVAAFLESYDITRPSCRIAAHVRNAPGACCGNVLHHALRKPCAWGINNQRIHLADSFDLTCCIAANNIHVNIVDFGITAQIAHR